MLYVFSFYGNIKKKFTFCNVELNIYADCIFSQNLLALLGSTSNQNVQLTTHAAKTLGDLAACLMSRMRYYQDPSLYTPKQGLNYGILKRQIFFEMN